MHAYVNGSVAAQQKWVTTPRCWRVLVCMVFGFGLSHAKVDLRIPVQLHSFMEKIWGMILVYHDPYRYSKPETDTFWINVDLAVLLEEVAFPYQLSVGRSGVCFQLSSLQSSDGPSSVVDVTSPRYNEDPAQNIDESNSRAGRPHIPRTFCADGGYLPPCTNATHRCSSRRLDKRFSSRIRSAERHFFFWTTGRCRGD